MKENGDLEFTINNKKVWICYADWLSYNDYENDLHQYPYSTIKERRERLKTKRLNRECQNKK